MRTRQVFGATASLLALAAGALAGTGSYQAHHRPAEELARMVGFALRSESCAFTADEKTNTVLIAGPDAGVKQALARLADVDRAPVPLTIALVVAVDGKPVWQGRVAALSGVTATLDTKSVRGGVTVTQVDGGYDVRAKLGVQAGARFENVRAATRTATAAELARLPVDGGVLTVRIHIEAAASR